MSHSASNPTVPSGATTSGAGSTHISPHVGRIPGRIVQTGKDARLPLFSRASATNLRLLHPEFDYRFFDDAQVDAFVEKEFPEYQSAYRRFPYAIQRFDFFRYLAVYRLGGFYFDLDVFLAKDLKPLLGYGCVFPFEELSLSRYLRVEQGMDWELGNYAFGSAAGHPFLKAVIDNCVRSLDDPGWALKMIENIPKPFRGQFVVTNTTGPGLVTRTLAENPELRSSVTILFPEDVCREDGWHRFGDFGVHLMNASWRKRDGFWIRRLSRLWENSTRARLLQQSQALGPARPGAWGVHPCGW